MKTFGKFLIFTLAFFILLSTASAEILVPTDPQDKLIVYLKMDENQGTVLHNRFHSGTDYNATFLNGTWTIGRYDYGVELNENGEIVLNSTLNFSTPYTFAFWVRIDSDPSLLTSYEYRLIDALDTTNKTGFYLGYRGYFSFFSGWEEKIELVYYDVNGVFTSRSLTVDFGDEVSKWVFVKFYISDSSATIHVQSKNNYYGYTWTSLNMNVAESKVKFGVFLDGVLDEILIWENTNAVYASKSEAAYFCLIDLNNKTRVGVDSVRISLAKQLATEYDFQQYDNVTGCAATYWSELMDFSGTDASFWENKEYIATITKTNYYPTNFLFTMKSNSNRVEKTVSLVAMDKNVILEKFTLLLIGKTYGMDTVSIHIYSDAEVETFSSYFDVQGVTSAYLDLGYSYKIVLKTPDGNYYYGVYRPDPSGVTTITIPPGDTQDYQYVTFKVYKEWKPYNATIDIKVDGINLYNLQTGDDGTVAAYLKKTQKAQIIINNGEKNISVYPISDVYVIMIPGQSFNESVNQTMQQYNMSLANNTFNLFNVTKEFNQKASPAAKGIVSSFILLSVMGGVAISGFEASPIGIFVLIILAMLGVTDWITALISILAVIGLFVIRRGVSG